MNRRDFVLLAAFPAHPEAEVREMVGAAHVNPARVRELLRKRPALVNAAWDWGFGDWETALGAAAHMGNKEIAGILLDAGAAPTLFSAAMLGQLDAVKAMIAARPGAFRLAGPHGIPLIAHAKAGGAAEVVAFLESLGPSGGNPALPVTPAEQERLQGVFGAFQVTVQRGQLQLSYQGGTGRPLHCIGPRTFHPAGAPEARVIFGEDYATLTVTDGETRMEARRTP